MTLIHTVVVICAAVIRCGSTSPTTTLSGCIAQLEELQRNYDATITKHMVESSKLKEEISRLRTEMEGILTELQTVMDMKLSLEIEIRAYRQLLESVEDVPVNNT